MNWDVIKGMCSTALLGLFIGLLVGVGCVREPEERTAYARGYAACRDSMAMNRWEDYAISTTQHPDTVTLYVLPNGRLRVHSVWKVAR